MARVWTEIVLSMATGEVLRESFFEYSGPVALCKDHGQDVANQQRQQELNMQTQAFNKQMAQLDKLNSDFGKYTQGAGQGYDPAQLAAMRSQALDQNALAYNGAGAGVRSALAARGSAGGDAPVGGDYTRGIASLEGAAASDRASTLTNIDLSNLQQALTNKFNAGSILSGNAATLNGTQGVAGQGASSALGQYVAAKSIPGFGEQFSGALAKGLGSGVASFATGGFGSLGSQLGAPTGTR